MIAMQYSFTLPADYDMSIIDRRIAEKGHLMDGFPGLVFKAYLSARKTSAQPPHCENLYAPFYLWQACEGMNAFLSGAGFAGLSQSFGWPSVKTWSAWHAAISPAVSGARFATRLEIPIPPYTALSELRADEVRRADEFMAEHAGLATVVGFEPTNWHLVRFQLWGEHPAKALHPEERIYTVGHMSKG
jgi:hypothetical protein